MKSSSNQKNKKKTNNKTRKQIRKNSRSDIRKNKWRLFIVLFLMTFSILIFIYSLSHIFTWKKSSDNNKKIKKEIEKVVNVEKDDDKIDFEELKKQNDDIVAYIKINNTNIDYPVVKSNDNEYYLEHNLKKQKNLLGWIFADYKNKITAADKNIVLYGHNARDGSMFASLNNLFKKDFDKDTTILLITPSDTYKYKIFSIYKIKPEAYYINTEFKDSEFKIFINTIKNRSQVKYDIDINDAKQILTLSTCTNDGNKRIVVHAKKVEE